MGKKDKTRPVVHAKKKPVSKAKRVFVFFLAQILLAASIFLALVTINSMEYRVKGVDYDTTYSIDLFEQSSEFENSSVFNSIFKDTVDDILYLSVIKNQFEEKGAFDKNKTIDITDYAYRKDNSSKGEISAEYSLDNLLKWGRSGTEYTGVYISLYNYGVAPEDIQSINIPEYAFITDEEGNYVPEVWMLQPFNYYTSNADIYNITENEGYYYGYVNILKNKYSTVDGKTIDSLVNNWSDYFELIKNLEKTIKALNNNYYYYTTLNPYYSAGNTNVKYCVRQKINGKYYYQTNIENIDALAKDDGIGKYFQENCVRYLDYSPNDFDVSTNTDLTQSNINSILESREIGYAFSDDTKVWVGVDAAYASNDAFTQARDKYVRNTIPAIYLLSGACIFALLYLVLMIYLCCKTGWKKDAEGNAVIELNGLDEIYTELFLVFVALLFALVYIVVATISYGSGLSWVVSNPDKADYILIAFTICFFVIACLLDALFLSFIRRCKSGTLFKNSLIATAGRKIVASYENSCGNKPGSVGIFLAYLGYLIINCAAVLVAVFLAYRQADILGLIVIAIMLLIDLFIGFYHMKCRKERFDVIAGIERIRGGDTSFKLNSAMFTGSNKNLAEAANHIGDGIHQAVETSMKDEKMKADLITNVSHDIKTPLTSIINYVDLLKREDIQDEKIRGYIDVLDEKSQRLKQLTVDLVEASKISSGNITYELNKINFAELVNQALGEFEDKFSEKQLQVVTTVDSQKPFVMADSRHMWRVMENILVNVYKYAMPGTRVYVNVSDDEINKALYTTVSVKNISAQPLNIKAEELTERFIRGDVSRSSEGSGLGLSIAKSLTTGQNGKFDIYLDGDLFKASVSMPSANE